jgi:hypothetical protein
MLLTISVAGECLLSANMQLMKTNLSVEIIDVLSKVKGDEDIEPILREQAKEYKLKLPREIDTLHRGDMKE